MLLSELRNLLKKYDENELRVLIVEMYKSMPKKLREEKDIDRLVEDVNKVKKERKKGKDENIDFESLKPEIEIFIQYAYNQCYFAPNNFVHKKERPKWRFKVKRFIKVLSAIPVNTKDGEASTELLEKIYTMLCYACAYYLFNTNDPFNSVGIDAGELIKIIIARKFENGADAESIKSMIALIIKAEEERSYSKSYFLYCIISYLKTNDLKEIAIEKSEVVKIEIATERQTRRSSWDRTYWYEKRVNAIAKFVLILKLETHEYKKGISYFRKYHKESNKEISLYVLLRILLEYDLKEYWIIEYERALKKGIDPRESLQEIYRELKEKM